MARSLPVPRPLFRTCRTPGCRLQPHGHKPSRLGKQLPWPGCKYLGWRCFNGFIFDRQGLQHRLLLPCLPGWTHAGTHDKDSQLKHGQSPCLASHFGLLCPIFLSLEAAFVGIEWFCRLGCKLRPHSSLQLACQPLW